ncbi:MAG: hypothetical protein IJF09_07050 [Ruminiclostridium sp.]|nr:hypothetical protein [Ruminiclostridium sp.]
MTMFFQELKKLFIKQYVLIFIIVLAILKLLLSGGLWSADYGSLSPEQKEQYLRYIERYGGRLNDEKEQGIIRLYKKLLDAKAKVKEHQDKLNKGELDDAESYLESLDSIPDIIRYEAAITLLFSKYESVSPDTKNRLLIASDAPVMTIGMDYFLLIFSAFITALSLYYERKMKPLNITAINNGKAVAARLISLFIAVALIQLLYSIICFFALISEIGAENLNISVASLESFMETPYPSLTIVGAFIFIELAKLLGALFTSAVAMILMLITENLILSALTPIAVNVLWIYYFGTSTESYYSPFALLRPSAYFTGRKEHQNIPSFYEYQSIEPLVFMLIIAVAVITIAFACLLYMKKNKNNKISLRTLSKPPIVSIVILLCFFMVGCSNEKKIQFSANAQSAYSDFAYSDDCYFTVTNKTVDTYKDENGFVRSEIKMYDDTLKVTAEKLNRGVFSENYRVYRVASDERSLYYLMDDISNDKCLLYKVDIKSRTENVIYTGDMGALRNGTPKYLDMMTVWPDADRKSIYVNDFIICDDTVLLFMESGEVYTVSTSGGGLSYLFEDVKIKYPCISKGALYYVNLNNKVVKYDKEKTIITEKQYMNLTVDNVTGKLYCQDEDSLFLLDEKTGDATKIYSIGNNDFTARVYDDNILLVSPFLKKAIYLSGGKETEITDISDAYVTDSGIVIIKENIICYQEENNE